jgi:hypothetical protein
MKENERQRLEIEQQTLKYLAKGGKVTPVDHTANKGWREKDIKKTNTYMPSLF